MSHTYLSVEAFKRAGAADITDNATDTQILLVLESVSTELEDITRRSFHPLIATRYLNGSGTKVLELPWDLISITTLKEDSNDDGTYDTTWATTDYWLGPYDAQPTSLADPSPYWWLTVNTKDTGSEDIFRRAQRAYELAGKFGYCELTQDTGATVNETFTDSDTTLTVSNGSKIDVGDTLVIENEYLYVSGEPVDEGNDITVTRGSLGSTAASHTSGATINRLTYPRPIIMATMMQASKIFERRRTGWSEQTLGDLGLGNVKMGLGADVLDLLDRYRIRTAV